jgi:redox-sensitive bicupin YhaK (pirin superfamily)
MLQKINTNLFRGNGPIKVLYPGLVTGKGDSGLGSIGRIDHANFVGKHHIAMHPHVNDEILSYFRSGKVRHRDSEGFQELISGNRLMLMKAGKFFHHEEDIDGTAEPHEGLQIFIRPGEKDLQPQVIFHDLETLYSDNDWRLLASAAPDAALQFSSRTWIYDNRLSPVTAVELPALPARGLTGLLYVYQGAATINGDLQLQKQEGLIFRDEAISIGTGMGAELVLFLTDEQATIYKGGMYSGNQFS